MRELFENAGPAAPRKNRAELMRDIDAAYYGFRDDEDGLFFHWKSLLKQQQFKPV